MREMDGFIDRSKVRILLCDNDSKGSGEVFTLLRKCSYQVISVKSPRQVIDALNAEGPNIDLILSEVDLPMAKGLKMLKYIMRKESQLQRIPVIMMSAQDEVTLVVKCLRLGAADYLVKPLRTNELLNLWTHMWRRRRMLGLTEIKLMNCEFDLVHSDHSDVNTNSTVFSDDTDERPRKTANQDISVSIHHENQINVILSNNQSYLPETKNHQQGCGPKKSELKMGESSAFFTYIKSNMSTKSKTTPVVSILDKEPCTDNQNNSQKIIMPRVQQNHSQTQLFHSSNNSHLSSVSIDDSTPPLPTESQFPKPQIQQGYTRHSAYPYHLHDPTNQFMMSHNNHFPNYNYNYNNHQIHGMMTSSFPYYYQQQQGGAHPHTWGMMKKVESRREAALEKFRKKRKERCYDKKIRYVNRKKLAERRPRVRGQFVRKVNGIDVDLNGYPTGSNDFDEYREEEEDDDDEVLKK